MKRKLCSIQKIDNITPIEGADKIEKINVLGWELVAQKGLYKIGDLAIYCEIDTILPEIPETEFMSKHNFRIKTIKLKGQVSQGLLLPLDVLRVKLIEGDFNSLELGQDVTALLGATKYEAPIPANLSGIAKASFPSFIPKTDEERIQANPNLLEQFKGERVYITEKLDGTSFTCYFNNKEFGVCSRNLELERGKTTQWNIVKTLKLEEKLKELNKNIAIQGEIVGEGIQKNPLKLKGHQLYVFNVFDIDKQEYYNFADYMQFCNDFGLYEVPIIEFDIPLNFTLAEIIKLSERNSELTSDSKAEGIVVRSMDNVKENITDNTGATVFTKEYRLSFKVISPEYLLKNNE